MKTRLIKIGNSQGILINKSFLEHYHFNVEVEIEPRAEGLLIKPFVQNPRHDWEVRFATAIQEGGTPEGEMLEGFENDFENNNEWTW